MVLCDEGAWLFLLSHSSNLFLCFFCATLFWTMDQASARVFLLVAGKLLPDIASGLLSHLLLSEI